MADLTALANQLDAAGPSSRAVIETPRGERNKFDYDPAIGMFVLGGLFPEGMVFTFFGFVPGTCGDDGDPLDILVLIDTPAHVGCLLDVRLIGVINAEQKETGRAAPTSGWSRWPRIRTSTNSASRSET